MSFKFKLTIEITAETTSHGKAFTPDEIVNAIRIHPHDTIDGFEIIPDLPGCDVVSDSFLKSVDIVSIDQTDGGDNIFDSFKSQIQKCLNDIIPVVFEKYEQQITEENDEDSHIVSLPRAQLPDGDDFDPWFKLDMFIDIACTHPAFDDCCEDGDCVVFHVNRDYANSYTTIVLRTFPDCRDEYGKEFRVPKEWLVAKISEMYAVTLDEFIGDYTFNQTFPVYQQAKADGVILEEWVDC